MKSFFSGKRMFTVIQLLHGLRSKSILKTYLLVTIALILTRYLVSDYISGTVNPSFNLGGVWLLPPFIFLIFSLCESFAPYRSSSQGRLFLMLPASSEEKFLGTFIYTAGIHWVCMLCIYFVLIYVHQILFFFGSGDSSFPNPVQILRNYAQFLSGGMLFYCYACFLAALFFQKFRILCVTFTFWIAGIVLTFATMSASSAYFSSSTATSSGVKNFIQFSFSPNDENSFSSPYFLLACLLFFLLTFLAYFKFKKLKYP